MTGCHSRFSLSLFFGALTLVHVALPRHGDCHQLGEVGIQAKTTGSVPEIAGGHHPRELLPSEFLDHQILGNSFLIPFSSGAASKAMATVTWPHGIFRVLHISRRINMHPLQWQLRAHWSCTVSDPDMPDTSLEEYWETFCGGLEKKSLEQELLSNFFLHLFCTRMHHRQAGDCTFKSSWLQENGQLWR